MWSHVVVVWIWVWLVHAATATTISGNYILTATTTSGTGAQTYNSLSRPTTLGVLSVSGTVTINGVSTSGATDGEVLYLHRNQFDQSTTLTHASGSGSASFLIPSGGTVSGRFGAQVMYYNGNWLLLGYTPN